MWDPYVNSARGHPLDTDKNPMPSILVRRRESKQLWGTGAHRLKGLAMTGRGTRRERRLPLVPWLGGPESAEGDDREGVNDQARFDKIFTYLKHRITNASCDRLTPRLSGSSTPLSEKWCGDLGLLELTQIQFLGKEAGRVT